MANERVAIFVGSSKKDLMELPEDVIRAIGYALDQAQRGQSAISIKPWHGLGSGVLEVVEDYFGDTYRAVFTVRFAGVLYVLHVFQKKSKRGIETPKSDIELIKRRLREAEVLHEKKIIEG